MRCTHTSTRKNGLAWQRKGLFYGHEPDITTTEEPQRLQHMYHQPEGPLGTFPLSRKGFYTGLLALKGAIPFPKAALKAPDRRSGRGRTRDSAREEEAFTLEQRSCRTTAPTPPSGTPGEKLGGAGVDSDNFTSPPPATRPRSSVLLTPSTSRMSAAARLGRVRSAGGSSAAASVYAHLSAQSAGRCAAARKPSRRLAPPLREEEGEGLCAAGRGLGTRGGARRITIYVGRHARGSR
ncbi:hypothetical protein AOLI_G00315440 [Acnodon oligacanthus]